MGVSKFSSEIIREIIDSNFIDLCISLSNLTGSAKKTSDYFCWAKNPLDKWFSRIFSIDFPKNLVKESVDHLVSEIESCEAPSLMLIRVGKYFDIISDSLKSNNFNMFYEQTGMYIDLANHTTNANSNLDIRTIDNLSELNKWTVAVEKIFKSHKNLTLYEKLLGEKDFTFFACIDNQQVIATTMLFINNDIAGVHLVGTLNEFRNKGIGTAITKKAFDHAVSKGARAGVLQASPMGKNMYKEIGFQEHSRITHWEYISKRID